MIHKREKVKSVTIIDYNRKLNDYYRLEHVRKRARTSITRGLQYFNDTAVLHTLIEELIVPKVPQTERYILYLSTRAILYCCTTC